MIEQIVDDCFLPIMGSIAKWRRSVTKAIDVGAVFEEKPRGFDVACSRC